MNRRFALTLDLESDYASLVPGVRHRLLDQPELVRSLLTTLAREGIRGTAFVVGKVIESHPQVIDVFEANGWEFELHSYSHNTSLPDSVEEIERGCEAFSRRFGRRPRGYRAPQGRITPDGIARLAERGFEYDSSVFPSYFPDPFKYLTKPREMHFWRVGPRTTLLEVPFSTVTPARLTLSISYMKLLGPRTYEAAWRIFGFPETICFDSHLHDFIVDENSYRDLPIFWRMVYGRNKHEGLRILTGLLALLRDSGYRFEYLSQIVEGELQRRTETSRQPVGERVGATNRPPIA